MKALASERAYTTADGVSYPIEFDQDTGLWTIRELKVYGHTLLEVMTEARHRVRVLRAFGDL